MRLKIMNPQENNEEKIVELTLILTKYLEYLLSMMPTSRTYNENSITTNILVILTSANGTI